MIDRATEILSRSGDPTTLTSGDIMQAAAVVERLEPFAETDLQVHDQFRTRQAVLKATAGTMSLQHRHNCGASKVGLLSCPNTHTVVNPCIPGWSTGWGWFSGEGLGQNICLTGLTMPHHHICSALKGHRTKICR